MRWEEAERTYLRCTRCGGAGRRAVEPWTHCVQVLSFSASHSDLGEWVWRAETQRPRDRQHPDDMHGLSSGGEECASSFDVVFSYIFHFLLAVITTISPHFQSALLFVCWSCLCVSVRVCVCTHCREKGASYIRFGRGSKICLTCWGRRLEGETQNVFSITFSSHSFSNWFFFLSTHRSAWTADSWEGGVENCHYQADDADAHM